MSVWRCVCYPVTVTLLRHPGANYHAIITLTSRQCLLKRNTWMNKWNYVFAANPVDFRLSVMWGIVSWGSKTSWFHLSWSVLSSATGGRYQHTCQPQRSQRCACALTSSQLIRFHASLSLCLPHHPPHFLPLSFQANGRLKQLEKEYTQKLAKSAQVNTHFPA